jgi:hypothetical protein
MSLSLQKKKSIVIVNIVKETVDVWLYRKQWRLPCHLAITDCFIKICKAKYTS